MNITQAIAKLAEIRAFHGDVEVNVDLNTGGHTASVSEIEFNKDTGKVVVS